MTTDTEKCSHIKWIKNSLFDSPLKHALCFPDKGGRKFGIKIWEDAFRWNLDDLLEFIFPKEYSPACHHIAVDYLGFLIERGETTIKDKHEIAVKGYGVMSRDPPDLYLLSLIRLDNGFDGFSQGAWSGEYQMRIL